MRNCLNISGASDLWRMTYTHVYRETSSRTMNVYRFLTRDSTTLGSLKSTNSQASNLLVCAWTA